VELHGTLTQLGGNARKWYRLPSAEYLLAREAKFTHKPVSQLVSEGLRVLLDEQESINRFNQLPIVEDSLSDPDVQAEADASVHRPDAYDEDDWD
jgi:hypothetical protein